MLIERTAQHLPIATNLPLTPQMCALLRPHSAMQACSRRCGTASTRSFAGVQQQRAGRRQLHVVAVADITQAEFEQEVLKAEVPVLVDFWAPWCGPCKLVAPMMDWAEKEHKGALKVVKVEHGSSPELIEKYKVYGLPTFIVFKDGMEVSGSKIEGAIGKAALAEYLNKHIGTGVPAQ